MERPVAPSAADPVVDAYKKDVDQTLFDRTLALSPEERIRQLQAFVNFQNDLQRAGDLRRTGGA